LLSCCRPAPAASVPAACVRACGGRSLLQCSWACCAVSGRVCSVPGRGPEMPRARWQVGRNEVVITQEQAKTAKLAKGFALEPVVPGSLDQTVPLPEGTKRDRKKADIFGMIPMWRGMLFQLPAPFACPFCICSGANKTHALCLQATRISSKRQRQRKQSQRSINLSINLNLSLWCRKAMARMRLRDRLRSTPRLCMRQLPLRTLLLCRSTLAHRRMRTRDEGCRSG